MGGGVVMNLYHAEMTVMGCLSGLRSPHVWWVECCYRFDSSLGNCLLMCHFEVFLSLCHDYVASLAFPLRHHLAMGGEAALPSHRSRSSRDSLAVSELFSVICVFAHAIAMLRLSGPRQ